MHATRDTNHVIKLNGVGGRVMRGVRLLLRYSPLLIVMRGWGGWRSGLMKASLAVVDGLTSGPVGDAGPGAGWMSSPTSRATGGGLKMTRNLTTACTRPPTREPSLTYNGLGRRVMRGVRLLLWSEEFC